MRKMLGVAVCASLFVIAAACGNAPRRNNLPTPVPSSTRSADPAPYTRVSPRFEPIQGASIDFGELDGGVFQIEVPANWNGGLVIYFHGSHRGALSLYVEDPILRGYLIGSGYAWAATSYNTNVLVSGAAADQSAELWDYFAVRFGKPTRTYALGDSMGGAGALVAVERYPDRFSGALVSCGVAGVLPVYDGSADLLAAGAYAVGVTQPEYDAIPLYDRNAFAALVHGRIESAIKTDPAVRARFLDAWIEITGGPRPQAKEGYELGEMGGLWSLVVEDLSKGLGSNIGRHYQFSAASSINENDFNTKALRITPGPLRKEYPPDDPDGDIKAPVIMLHTTGDATVPLNEFQLNVRRVEGQGHTHLLSTRLYGRAKHCDFTREEVSGAFDDLVKWVETGVKATNRVP